MCETARAVTISGRVSGGRKWRRWDRAVRMPQHLHVVWTARSRWITQDEMGWCQNYHWWERGRLPAVRRKGHQNKNRSTAEWQQGVRPEDVLQQDSAGSLSSHGVQRIRKATTSSYERGRKSLLSQHQPCSETHWPNLVHEGSHGKEQAGRTAKIRVHFCWCPGEENQSLGQKNWNQKGSWRWNLDVLQHMWLS